MESLSIQLQPFFGWLLRATLQASLVICLILLLQTVLRSRLGVRWQYCLWLLLLVRMAMPWAPESRVSLFNLLPQTMPQRRFEHANVQVDQKNADPIAMSARTDDSPPISTTKVAQAESEATTVTPQPRKEAEGPAKSTFPKLVAMLPLAWLAGALVLAIYVCASSLNFLRIVRLRRPVTDQKILDLLEDCKSLIGIRTILGVVATDKVKCPALFGFVRPRLLLPEGMIEALSEQELRYVLLHELAHLKRHDIYVGWLVTLLQILHWFNPLVWLAFYRMRSDRELACDALVMARTQSDEPKSYGRIIVNLVERFSRPQRLPSMAGILETKARLKRRVTMITRFKKNSYQWSPLAVILIIILGCVSLPDAKGKKASGISAGESSDGGEIQQTGPIIRELNIQHSQDGFSLSRDGNKIVFCRRENRKATLMLRDLVSGEESKITGYTSVTSSVPVISPDGSQIIYTVTKSKEGKYTSKLHVIRTDTAEERQLDRGGFAADWGVYGRLILTLKEGDCIVSLRADPSQQVPMSLPDEVRPWRFSPDAKYVSCFGKGHLYLYQVDGGEITQVTQGSNEDKYPLWSPDGKTLVFLSRRLFGPEPDLCAVPVVDGKVVGTVSIIKPDFGDNVELSALSNTGRLFYKRSLEDRHVFWIPIDLQTGQPAGKPVKLASGTEPTWSPDGKQIAYIAEGVLHVMSVDGSNDQAIVKVNFPRTGTYAWAPDNDHIYVPEWRHNKAGISVISLTTRERRDVSLGHENIKRIIEHLTCSSDGKRLAFIGQPQSSKKLQVFIVDVDGTNLRQLTFDDTSNKYYPAWSPDGRQVAFEWRETGDGIWRLMFVSVDDGSTREVFRGKTKQDRFYRKSWSPDGRKIIWETDDEPRVGHVSGGRYTTFSTGFDGSGSPCWSPDGTKMLFGTWVNVEQLMIMDNFLPKADEALSAEEVADLAR